MYELYRMDDVAECSRLFASLEDNPDRHPEGITAMCFDSDGFIQIEGEPESIEQWVASLGVKIVKLS